MDIREEMRKTLCMLMAGGKGERLYPLTKDWAKPSVRFAAAYRIIDFTLSNCINSGIRRIRVLTQYRSVPLERHIRLGWNILSHELDEYIECVPPQQRNVDRWYRGTADSIYQNIHILQRERPERVLILSGDHIYKMDYNDMLAFHIRNNAELTVAGVEIDRSEASAFGVIGCNEDFRITSWEEKPEEPSGIPGKPDKSFVSMGIYIFDTDVLVQRVIDDAKGRDSAHDFGKNVVPCMLDTHRVFVHPFREPGSDEKHYWKDVGTLDAYWASNLDMASATPQCDMYDVSWPVRTLKEQMPPAKVLSPRNQSHSGRSEMNIKDSLLAGGCVIDQGMVSRSVLSYGVRTHPGSLVKDSVLLDDVSIGPNARVRKALIAQNVEVPAGFSIGYDPEEDARRFIVSFGGVVVVPEGAVLI